MRVISRIDIKNNYVIKGINLEGLRKIGEPLEIATKYYTYGVDEIILIDAVASLYKRNNLFKVVKEATKNIFVKKMTLSLLSS
jgi:cyclase